MYHRWYKFPRTALDMLQEKNLHGTQLIWFYNKILLKTIENVHIHKNVTIKIEKITCIIKMYM